MVIYKICIALLNHPILQKIYFEHGTSFIIKNSYLIDEKVS